MHTVLLVLVLLVVAGLIVFTFIVSFSSSKGEQSMASLSQFLRSINTRFDAHDPINVEQERKEMEILQNRVKVCCDEQTISNNNDLRSLFKTLCNHISITCDLSNLPDRSSWIKLKVVTSNFDDTYFHSIAKA
jgi:hypothetical protein